MTAEIRSTEYLRKARETAEARQEEKDLLKEANEAQAKELGFHNSFNSAHTIEPSKERAHENPPEGLRAPPLARGGLQPYPTDLNVADLGKFDVPTNNKPEVKTIRNKKRWEYSGWSKPPKGLRNQMPKPKPLTERQKALLSRRKKS